MGTDEATTTDVNGDWSFTDLDWTYAGLTVYEVVPDGSVQTLGELGYDIIGTNGNDQIGLDFANTLLGSIHGFKFEDLDANGLYDGADTPMMDVWSELSGDTDGDGDLDTLQIQTCADGKFSFLNLYPGIYTIEELFTESSITWAATVDHDGDTIGDNTTTVTIYSGQELVAFSGVQFDLPEAVLVAADQLAQRDRQPLGSIVVHDNAVFSLKDDFKGNILLARHAGHVQSKIEDDLFWSSSRTKTAGITGLDITLINPYADFLLTSLITNLILDRVVGENFAMRGFLITFRGHCFLLILSLGFVQAAIAIFSE